MKTKILFGIIAVMSVVLFVLIDHNKQVLSEQKSICSNLMKKDSLLQEDLSYYSHQNDIDDFEKALIITYEECKLSSKGIKLEDISGIGIATHFSNSMGFLIGDRHAQLVDCDAYPKIFVISKNYEYLMEHIESYPEDIKLIYTGFGSGYKDKKTNTLVLLLTMPVIQGNEIYPAGSIYYDDGTARIFRKW